MESPAMIQNPANSRKQRRMHTRKVPSGKGISHDKPTLGKSERKLKSLATYQMESIVERGKGGTTAQIRQRLQFVDERKWKQFSTRRLELIDTHHLATQKASEQDDNIRTVAGMLRDEFGYHAGYQGDFEKLVTAAIQSVRRNRKRSSKTRPVRFVAATPPSSDAPLSPPESKVHPCTTLDAKQRLVQELCDACRVPTVHSEIPPFLAEKLHRFVVQSKTLGGAAKDAGVLQRSTVLRLGASSLESGVCYVLERFFTLANDSMEYLLEKLVSAEFFSRVFVLIFGGCSQYVSAINDHDHMLRFVVGALVKDFGYESVMYALGEVLYHVIAKEYPLMGTTTESILMNTVALKPAVANEQVHTKVLLKYGAKSFEFKYNVLSNGVPTYAEMVKNCRDLFRLETSLVFTVNGEKMGCDEDFQRVFKARLYSEVLVIEVEVADGLSILSSVALASRASRAR